MISPSGTPGLAHSVLQICNAWAGMMLGSFPGISMPLAMSKPNRALLIRASRNVGPISTTSSVVSSKIAVTMFTHMRICDGNAAM